MKYTAPKVPCGSCPYRKDVPPGIWAASEYAKLPAYDGETFEQLKGTALFMCHQNTGELCGGWLECHDPSELLALRIHGGQCDPSVWSYSTDVPVFSSGLEAAAHGMSGVLEPPVEAIRKMAGLQKQRRQRQRRRES